MKEPNRKRVNPIKAINKIKLDEFQLAAKELIFDKQIVIVVGRAGSGKSALCAQAGLEMLETKMCKNITIMRPAIEVGKTLGFTPGDLKDKFAPYIEAFGENIVKITEDESYLVKLVEQNKLKGLPVQFVRSRTFDELVVVEEAQNLSKEEMLAILTRLGKTGKIIINGDLAQVDIKNHKSGLAYVIALAESLPEIGFVNLKGNHRSDLVAKILELEEQGIIF